MNFILAAKCAPDERILADIERAGIPAVELYLSRNVMKDPGAAIAVCRKFGFRYAVHAPNDDLDPAGLREFVQAVDAGVIILHDIFWEDEWLEIIDCFRDRLPDLCIENLGRIAEPNKFMRRFGMGRCLDLEHMQFEIHGVYEEEFINIIRESSHIHLTGYRAGSELWHTHLHHDAAHARYMLDLIYRSGYSGFVVSEARTRYQTYDEFRMLVGFFNEWRAQYPA
ncbi:MAG TPA: hypothetical protein PKM65_00750 [Spirochaetota bacterium]|nr:hypothetical protein [Spirochaetota bacterium]HNT11653.1 hypothetical protein [Spirochaetota bacterium]